MLQRIAKMLCSFVTDLIVAEVQCGECLCGTKITRDTMGRSEFYIVLLQSIAKMLCSLWADLVVSEVQYGEGLYEKK